MSKKKRSGGRPGVHSAAQVEANALLRFENACDYLVGAGHFRKFTKHCQKRLLAHRFDAVKMRMSAGSGQGKEDAKLYERIFGEQLGHVSITTVVGLQIPLPLLLREGLGLILYVESMQEEPLVHMPELVGLFAPYFSKEEFMSNAIAEVVYILQKLSIVLSDWSRRVFIYSVRTLGAYNGLPSENYVAVEMRKPESCMVRFDGISREAVRLCWTDINGEMQYVEVVPRTIGLRHVEDSVAVPVYIQQHALQRLGERLGLLPGVLHNEIFETFNKWKVEYCKVGLSSLVSFRLWDKKLGYLVCGYSEGKVVIRSFLFLTNDGTPEGKRLSELTQLQRLDKKYLEIDTLAGFIGFSISDDAELVELFTEAGCGDLLDLSGLKMYLTSEVKEKDVMRLLRYLVGRGKEERVEVF